MADYAFGEVANVLLPLPTSTGNALLQDADPALFHILSFWSAMLGTYLGPRLVAECAAAGVLSQGQAITAAVNPLSTLPYDPTPYLTEDQLAFPLLAVWRERGRSEWRTAVYEHDITTLGAAYILPPLTAAQAEKILPILPVAYDVIRKQTSQTWDPSYTPPGGTGPTPGPWTVQFAALEYIQVGKEGFTYGRWPGTGSLWFPGIMWKTLIMERDMFPPKNANYSVMQGGDITAGLVSADGSLITPFVQASTQPAPTLVGLSVTQGPYTGGTTVVIYGTGFQSNSQTAAAAPSVTFGNYAATVTFLSPQALQVTTPAMLGPGPYAVSVTVTNPDNQTVTAPNAFTFV